MPPAPGLPVAAAGAKEAEALKEREGVLVEVGLAPALPLAPPLLPVGFCPVAVGVRVGCRTVALGVLCPMKALPPVLALAAFTGERLPPPAPPLAVGRAPLPEGMRVAAGAEGVTLGLSSKGVPEGTGVRLTALLRGAVGLLVGLPGAEAETAASVDEGKVVRESEKVAVGLRLQLAEPLGEAEGRREGEGEVHTEAEGVPEGGRGAAAWRGTGSCCSGAASAPPCPRVAA